MKIESTGFTRADMNAFAADLLDHERVALADRLEADSARLAALVARLGEEGPSGDEGWSARDILAHIAVFSKFYGVLTYKVGSGEYQEIDLLDNIQKRDVFGERLARRPAAELLASIQADHQHTVSYLRSADAAAMRRQAAIGEGVSISADEIARLFLIAHLEQHIDQLEPVGSRQ
jgi:hypothetical protein